MSALAYFITFTAYGTWLHGDERGCVDRDHNRYSEPYLRPDAGRRLSRESTLVEAPYQMDKQRRGIVLSAIVEHAAYKQWRLHAVHVRTNHVHVVVSGNIEPERIMNEFKSYASRALNAAELDIGRRHRWTRHGSTRYLFDEDAVLDSIDYVLNRQGSPMAVFRNKQIECE